MLQRVISTLQQLSFVNNICVSSDDQEILSLAIQTNAITLEPREAKLSDDHTSIVELFKFDLGRFIKASNQIESELIVLIVLPTAALINVETLNSAYQQFLKSGVDIMTSLKQLEFSPARALEKTVDGLFKPFAPDRLMQRTQDQPIAAIDAGQFYFLNYSEMRNHQGHWFNVAKGIAGYLLQEHEAIDVDTEEDWLNLERVFRALKHGT